MAEHRLSFSWSGTDAKNGTNKGNGNKCSKSDACQEKTRNNNTDLSVGSLAKAKSTALRRGIWFRALNRIERGVLDLTVRFVDNIRSATLVKIVTTILNKLKLAMENTADRLVRTVGMSLAQKISAIAVKLGNLSAVSWADDIGFALYLSINSPSNPSAS